ncbi:hypothetical protein [Pseudomonas sp. PB3P13]
MNGSTAAHCSSWVILGMLATLLGLTTGCSGKAATSRYTPSSTGSSCYAKALPSIGEGGLAWGDTLNVARNKSMNNCIRYAERSGGTPNTCQVVLAECRK